MTSIDHALDEYLHRIARVRPWTRPQEEPTLGALCRWLDEQPGPPVGVASLTAATVSVYADHAALTPPERCALWDVLDNFYRWAVRDGFAETNPFARGAD